MGRGEEEGDESRRTTPLSLAFVTQRATTERRRGERAAVNESDVLIVADKSVHKFGIRNLESPLKYK